MGQRGVGGQVLNMDTCAQPVPEEGLREHRTSPTGAAPSQSPGGERTDCVPSLKRPRLCESRPHRAWANPAGPSRPSEDSPVLQLLGWGPGPSSVDLNSLAFCLRMFSRAL